MKKMRIIIVIGMIGLMSLAGCSRENNSNGQNGLAALAENKVFDLVLNEPFLVTTTNGDYNLTINGLRKTSERNQNESVQPMNVVFLDYSYDNISYKMRFDMDFFLASGDFKVVDEEGNIVSTYNLKDPNRMIKETPIGDSCSASIAYALKTNSDRLTVIFVRGKRNIAQISLPIE